MRKILFAFCVLLVAVSAGFATTPSDASLKGKYSFQLNNAHMDSWYASITCYDPQGNPYTVTAGGSQLDNESILGTISFDGKGNVTNGAYTQYGQFDQAASNATVVPSCNGNSNNGYAVFDPAPSGTLTGTYSVEGTGFGTMVITPSGQDAANFIIELAGTTAVRTTVMMTEYDPSTYRMEMSGVAILQ